MKTLSRNSTAKIEIKGLKDPSVPSKISFRSRKIRKTATKIPSSAAVVTSTVAVSNSSLSPRNTNSLSAKSEIDIALNHLRISDPLLASVIAAHEPPTFNPCRSPFLSLSKSILYQQLATKSAKCIYDRFLSLLGGESGVVPSTVLSFSQSHLRQIGVSSRKSSYLHDLSNKFVSGNLSDSSILEMDDEELLRELTAVKGIGVWSVHMFMMFALHRPDVLPVGDLGVRKGVQILYGLKELPKPLEMEHICEKWKPYRSVGAWYMWRLIEAKKNSS